MGECPYSVGALIPEFLNQCEVLQVTKRTDLESELGICRFLILEGL